VRTLVTGGAGFLGSHLCERLIREGWEVICYDSLLTGAWENLAPVQGHERFTFVEGDVTKPIEIDGPLDWVMNLASPVSPPDYLEHPIHTLKVGSLGTLHALGLAKAKQASFLTTSTSEVYGDPLVHPQPETYWGNVNPVGPRGVYDEAKRFAEALTMAYHRVHGIPIRIARVFNTYGPRMRRRDGRAVPNFIDQALHGDALTVYGDGSQTRSLCYVDDLIEGIWRFVNAEVLGPMNLGSAEEVTMLELAELIKSLVGSSSELVFEELPIDDPVQRRPDTTLAQSVLGWKAEIDMRDGLTRTIEWARNRWAGE